MMLLTSSFSLIPREMYSPSDFPDPDKSTPNNIDPFLEKTKKEERREGEEEKRVRRKEKLFFYEEGFLTCAQNNCGNIESFNSTRSISMQKNNTRKLLCWARGRFK